jgi:tetratricopeptide (TPR) repeat protein
MKVKTYMRKVAQPLFSAAVCYSALIATGVVANQFGIETSSVVYAQEQNKPSQPTRKTPAMRQPVYEQLAKAQEKVQEKDFEGAIDQLDSIHASHQREKKVLNSYELASLFAQYAFIYYTLEKYDQAITYNEKVVEQPDIPLGMEINTRYTIAQLYFVVENYPKAVKALEGWFKVAENPPANAYVLACQGYYQLERYDEALVAIEKAMEVAKAKGKEPKEQWFLLMRALYFDKGDLNKVAWVLEQLARKWPKRDYFVQLSSVHAQLGDEKNQLGAHDIAYKGWDFDNESGLLNMGYLYMGNDTPYRGATVIEKGLKSETIRANSKNYTTVAQAFAIAQETKRALPYMEKAAETAKDGEPWASLASVYFDSERYDDAIKAARTALKKGGLKRPENTRILIGMTLFNMDKLKEAKSEFRKAQEFASVKDVASQWIKYINGEIRRKEALSNS